jgi:hypothetical protein
MATNRRFYHSNRNSSNSRKAQGYTTPEGMTRLWTVTGKNGVGRLLANAQKETFIHLELHTSVDGKQFEKPAHFKCPTSAIDAAAMKLNNRPDGTPNFAHAIQIAVDGQGKLLFLPKQAAPAAETAPVAAEAPVASEAAPAAV